MKFFHKKHLILTVIILFLFTSCSNTNTSIESSNESTNKSQFNILESKNNSSEIEKNTIIDEENDIEEEIDKEEKETLTISKAYEIPEGFVYVDDIIPDIVVDAKYFTDDNFIGKKINGYEGNLAILTVQAADALKSVQEDFKLKGLGLKIYDAYRPQKAVDHFSSWAKDYNDTKMKSEHYPNVKKSDLFSSGYIAYKSGHSRGSTVDLTIIDLETKEELDMGTIFDFLGIEARYNYEGLNKQQRNNRDLLKSTMEHHGFRYYKNEWWHYTLNDEPYKGKYFNFDVK